MPDYTVLDLLKFSNEGKPQDFKTAFDSVMKDRISAAIDARKETVADQMFNGASEEESESEVEVDDSEEELDVDSDEDIEVDEAEEE